MIITLHQPIKSAWQLKLSWRNIVMVIVVLFRHWIKIRAYEIKNHCGTFRPSLFFLRFPKEKGSFGYYHVTTATVAFRKLADLPLSPAETLQKLKVRMTIASCTENISLLPCGCENCFDLVKEISPRRSDDIPCETCGAYHYFEDTERKYIDCEKHAEMFRKWPKLSRHSYESGKYCQQIVGISPMDASGLLEVGLRENSLNRLEQEELCGLIVPSSYYSMRAVMGGEKLDPNLRNRLAFRVRRLQHAIWALEKHPALSSRAMSHLKRVVLVWNVAIWFLRIIVAVAIVTTWWWYIPDWRTVATLVITVAGVAAILSLKKWLKE